MHFPTQQQRSSGAEVKKEMDQSATGTATVKGNHAGSQSDIPDIDQLIDANPCSKLYLELEDCLVETNRSWSKCQQQVRFERERISGHSLFLRLKI
jgi:hypothetical protein